MTLDVERLRKVAQMCLLNKSVRNIAALNGCSPSTAVRIRARLKQAGFSLLEDLNKVSDAELSQKIYARNNIAVDSSKEIEILDKHVLIRRTVNKERNVLVPDFDRIIDECVRSKASIQTAYIDYLEQCKVQNKRPYSRSYFFKLFKAKLKATQDPVVTMYQMHSYGEAVQLDLAGDTLKFIKPDGSAAKLYILVMTWPASYYTYAALIPDMTTASFCEGIVKGLQFFGCKPDCLIIDNAKALVTKHHVGADEIFNEQFSFFMRKLGILIDANNPRSPTSKSAVERTVGIVCDRCLSRLKKEKYQNIEEYSLRLLSLVDQYINKAPFRQRGSDTQRETLFNQYEKLKAHPLPDILPGFTKYYPGIKVPSNYLVNVEGHLYSVPYRFVGKQIDAEVCGSSIVFFHDTKVIAGHLKSISDVPQILPEHMPKGHAALAKKRSMYNTEESILAEAKLQSLELFRLCEIWLNRDGMQKKKACIYSINLYKRNYFNVSLLDEAVRRMRSSTDYRLWNTYTLRKILSEIKDEVMSSDTGRFMTQEDIIEDVLSNPDYTYLRTVKPVKGE
ncbi:hypothetical protein M3084_10505 [Succinatimonas hippei]|uniref:Mu transposase domain-containing protein n=1 Tax=Succinatimonas hippei TaxID=626938 RepID=UPI0020130454|nr:hypothetical protein [Succinatimonas hippei]MCL1604271.1 hypothetical protein [Succinatimonas hippei]